MKLALNSVGRLLAQLGITCQKPLAKAREQNETLVERWLAEEYPAIKAQAEAEGAEIYTALKTTGLAPWMERSQRAA